MTIYYIKQFNIYYAGTRHSSLVFTNDRNNAIAFYSKEAAQYKIRDIGTDCKIEERIISSEKKK